MRSAFNFWSVVYRWAVVCTVLGLAACRGGAQTTPFRPPTLAAQRTQPAPTLAAVAETTLAAIPSATPACTNNLTFIEDLTIPDGTTTTPGSLLDKRWRVQNSGTCNWNAGYHIKLYSGSDLGAPAEQALYPARGGTALTIQLIFNTPAEAGLYQSAWQAYDPQGNAFGDPFYIQFVVEAP